MIRPFALWAVLLVQAVSVKPASSIVQGIVVDADTGAPLAGAHLSFYQKDPNAIVNIHTGSGDGHRPADAGSLAITDDHGQFEFKDLDAFSYSITSTRNGYESKSGEYPSAGRGQIVRDVVIRMTPTSARTGKVSGHIRDSVGRPVPLVKVLLFRRSFDAIGNPSFNDEIAAQTNDLGEFRMYDVKPGHYYVVCDGDIRNWSDNPNVSRSNYALSFYPGVSDFNKASTIEVRRGVETESVDFQTRRTGLYRIRVRIIDSSTGRPPAQASIRLTNPGLRGGSHISGLNYNSADGSMESAALPPGTYTLEAKTTENVDETAEAVVVVDNSDVNGLLLILARASSGHSLSGRISVEGELPRKATLKSIGTSFELIPQGALEALKYGNSAFDSTMNDDGTFTLADIPEGEYRVNLKKLPPGYYVRAALLDGDDILSQSRRLAHAVALDIVLAKGGQVDGIVRTEGLQSVHSLLAVLIPDDRSRKDLFTSIRTDANGRFTFQGVAPGNYKIFSWDHLEDHEYFDPEFLRDFETLGRPVRVADASTISLEIKAIARPPAP